jgi:hypothetical protein
MPDYLSTDREDFDYADVLRGVRRDLLDRLAGADVKPRQKATSADSKRDKRTGPAAAASGPGFGRRQATR